MDYLKPFVETQSLAIGGGATLSNTKGNDDVANPVTKSLKTKAN